MPLSEAREAQVGDSTAVGPWCRGFRHQHTYNNHLHHSRLQTRGTSTLCKPPKKKKPNIGSEMSHISRRVAKEHLSWTPIHWLRFAFRSCVIMWEETHFSCAVPTLRQPRCLRRRMVIRWAATAHKWEMKGWS